MTTSVSLDEVAAALQASWSTASALGDQPRLDPAAGQCAVTALVVQDYFGGHLLRAIVGGESHYWNRLPDGSECDLTRQQFDDFRPRLVEQRSREYTLSHQDTLHRYRVLRDSVAQVLTRRSSAGTNG